MAHNHDLPDPFRMMVDTGRETLQQRFGDRGLDFITELFPYKPNPLSPLLDIAVFLDRINVDPEIIAETLRQYYYWASAQEGLPHPDNQSLEADLRYYNGTLWSSGHEKADSDFPIQYIGVCEVSAAPGLIEKEADGLFLLAKKQKGIEIGRGPSRHLAWRFYITDGEDNEKARDLFRSGWELVSRIDNLDYELQSHNNTFNGLPENVRNEVRKLNLLYRLFISRNFGALPDNFNPLIEGDRIYITDFLSSFDHDFAFAAPVLYQLINTIDAGILEKRDIYQLKDIKSHILAELRRITTRGNIDPDIVDIRRRPETNAALALSIITNKDKAQSLTEGERLLLLIMTLYDSSIQLHSPAREDPVDKAEYITSQYATMYAFIQYIFGITHFDEFGFQELDEEMDALWRDIDEGKVDYSESWKVPRTIISRIFQKILPLRD